MRLSCLGENGQHSGSAQRSCTWGRLTAALCKLVRQVSDIPSRAGAESQGSRVCGHKRTRVDGALAAAAAGPAALSLRSFSPAAALPANTPLWEPLSKNQQKADAALGGFGTASQAPQYRVRYQVKK